jgi:capsular exopolysaccharide synthesis family protein
LRHPVAEAFRVLRTNIDISQADQPLKTILVTSAGVGDGKTSVAANLALSIAQREKVVILVDVDLRRPSVHEFFELPNDRGLVDLLSDDVAISDVLQFKKVAVLPSGGTPDNPTELLSSEKMDQLLTKLEKAADVVIIDGPPFLVADAMVMAAKVDGVLLVVRPGHTSRSLAIGAAEQLKRSGARLIGVVLNRIPLRGANYYAGRSYIYTYYLSNYGNDQPSKEKGTDLQKLRGTLSPHANRVTEFFRDLFEPRPPDGISRASALHHRYMLPLIVVMLALVVLAGVFSMPGLLVIPALYLGWFALNIYWEFRSGRWRRALPLVGTAIIYGAALFWFYVGIAGR